MLPFTRPPTLQPSAKPTMLSTHSVCPCGTYLNAAQTECTTCSPGLYNPGIGAVGNEACVSCPAGTVVDSTQCSCSVLYAPTAKPTPIPAVCGCGQYWADTGCVTCGGNLYSPGYGATSPSTCAACPAGFYPSPDKCSCLQPVAPTLIPTKYPTLKPTLLPTPVPSGNACGCGSYSASGNTPCALCPAGSYSPLSGEMGCYICPEGYTSQSGSCECDIALTHKPTKRPVSSPTKMPIGTPTEEPTTAMPTHSPCGCGHYLNGPYTDPDAVCTPCPAGTYSPGDAGCDVQNCATCPEGFTSEPGACVCVTQPTAFPTVKSTAAPTAKPSMIPTSRPTALPTPQPSPLPTPMPTDGTCPCGTFFVASVGEDDDDYSFGGQCMVCPGNMRTLQPGATSKDQCVPCPYGTMLDLIQNQRCNCIPIPTGNPIASPTQVPTEHPIPNPTLFPTVEPTAQPTQYPTPTPTFHPSYQPCTCGTYLVVNSEGVGSCSYCPAGTYNAVYGSTESDACIPCEKGYRSDSAACYCIPNPTSNPSPIPTPLPTFEPTFIVCPCGAYLTVSNGKRSFTALTL